MHKTLCDCATGYGKSWTTVSQRSTREGSEEEILYAKIILKATKERTAFALKFKKKRNILL